MHVDPNSPRARLTKRQQEILERLERGQGAKQIAADIGVSRTAVYQHIERLRRQGAVAAGYTPSGQPPRRADVAAPAPMPGTPAPRESALASLRADAREGEAAGPAYARALEGAIAAGDAVALAYELGRLDALGERGLQADLVESALSRLSILALDADADQ